MKTILCIFLIFLTSLGKSYAQTLFRGTVSNLQSKPLPYATVNFLASDKSTVIFSTVTDSSGIYKIAINEDTLLKNSRYVFATYLKAKSDTLLIENVQSQLNIVVNDSISVLSNVVVESKIPTMQRKADRFVFTPNQQMTQGSSSLDLLRIIPLIQYDEKSNFFSIINRADTVVYINNRKSNMPKDMIISILRSTPAENIKNVEIITNPGSEYSANTTGGVININLKRMYYEGWSGNLTLSNQQSVYNTAILSGSVNYRKNKVGLRISPFINNSFNYSRTEFVIDPNSFQSQSNDIISHRKYLVLGGGIGLDYNITSHDLLSFNGFISSVNGQTKQSNTTIYSSGIPRLIDSVYDSPVRGNDTYLYNFGNIYYQHSFDSSEKKILTLTVDYNQYQQKNKNLGEFNKLPITDNDSYKYQNILPQHFLNFSARADYTWQINDRNKLSSGYQESATNVNNDLSYYSINKNNQYQLDPNLSRIYRYHENYHAFYVSLAKTLSSKFNSSVGLRFETLLLAQFCLFIGNFSSGFFSDLILTKLNFNLSVLLKESFFKKLIKLPIQYFDTRLNSDTLQRLTDLSKVQSFLTWKGISFLINSLNLLIFSIILLYLNTLIFSVFFVLSALSVVWVGYFLKRRATLEYSMFIQQSENSNLLYEFIMNMPEIKVNRAEPSFIDKISSVQKKLNLLELKSLYLNSYQLSGANFILKLKELITIAICAYLIIYNQMTIGTLLSISYIIGQLSGPIITLINNIHDVQDANISNLRVEDVYSVKNEVEENVKLTDIAKVNIENISIANVSFKYPGSFNPFVLKDISFEILKNKTTAIVGTSGSGKTTLLKLLLLYYHPTQGSININDDLSFSMIDPNEWRKNCGIVLQDGHIFSGTIAYNIALCDTEQIDEEK